MHAVRLLVCLALTVPVASFVDTAASALVSDQPLFRSSTTSRTPRRLGIGAVVVVTYVLAAWRFSDASWLELLAYLTLFAVLLVLALVDMAEYRLPDVVVLPSLLIGAIVVIVVSTIDGAGDRILPAFLAAALAFVVLLVAHLVSPRGMGFGDVKLAALLGLAVGWQATSALESAVLVLWMLLIGFGVGSIAGVVLWIVRRSNQPFPFGPFLAIGTVVTVLVSGALVG